VLIEGLAPTDDATERLLAAVAVEPDAGAGRSRVSVDPAVSLGFGHERGHRLLANGSVAAGARVRSTAPTGLSTHVITVSGTPVRLQLEDAVSRGAGRLAVSGPSCRRCLPRRWLMACARASHAAAGVADRHVLLFEQQNHL
jgi:hypothetical protein